MLKNKKCQLVIAGLALIVPLLSPMAASADALTNRSLALGSSAPNALTTHTFSFTTMTTSNIGSISFEYCTTGSGVCTTPAGLSSTSAILSNQSGTSGFGLNHDTEGRPYLTRTPTSLAGGSAVSFTLANMVNPSATNTSFYGRVTTYSSADGAGGAVDSGTTVASTATGIGGSGSVSGATVILTNLYRFFNTISGEHFYTPSSNERDYIASHYPDWHYEGIGFSVYALTDPNTCSGGSPVYRFFNVRSGLHHFTISVQERDNILATAPDWHFENIGFCADQSPQSGSVTVYRFFNVYNGQHLYTSSVAEVNYIINNDRAWHFEGVAFYVM